MYKCQDPLKQMSVVTNNDRYNINYSIQSVSYTHLDVYKRQLCVCDIVNSYFVDKIILFYL